RKSSCDPLNEAEMRDERAMFPTRIGMELAMPVCIDIRRAFALAAAVLGAAVLPACSDEALEPVQQDSAPAHAIAASSALMISNVKAKSGQKYLIDQDLRVGDLLYSDRPFTIVSPVPDVVLGAQFI